MTGKKIEEGKEEEGKGGMRTEREIKERGM